MFGNWWKIALLFLINLAKRLEYRKTNIVFHIFTSSINLSNCGQCLPTKSHTDALSLSATRSMFKAKFNNAHKFCPTKLILLTFSWQSSAWSKQVVSNNTEVKCCKLCILVFLPSSLHYWLFRTMVFPQNRTKTFFKQGTDEQTHSLCVSFQQTILPVKQKGHHAQQWFAFLAERQWPQ